MGEPNPALNVYPLHGRHMLTEVNALGLLRSCVVAGTFADPPPFKDDTGN